ncbi:MAG: hypothetical protein NTW78_06180 [Campylobacterales bacterium]|nr:hypothetical protein [Campylobacterales bacterium]
MGDVIKRNYVDIDGYSDSEIKNKVIRHMILCRYDGVTPKDVIDIYFPNIKTKSERMKIQRTFEKLEKGGIVKSTSLKKDYKKFKYKSWESYEVIVGDKVFENERKVEKKDIRKPNTNKYVLSKSIKLKDKKEYSEDDIKPISLMIGKMLTDKDDYIDYSESLIYLNDYISDKFALQTNFIKNTVSKVGITFINHIKGDKPYPLNLLLSLIQLKSNLNVSIQTDTSKMDLSGVKIESIIFGKKSFDLKFKNTTVTLKDISEIKSIQSFEESDLEKDIEKLKTILSEYSNEVTKPLTDLIDGLIDIKNIFFQ